MPLYSRCRSCNNHTNVSMLNDNELCPDCTNYVHPDPLSDRMLRWFVVALVAVYDFVARNKPVVQAKNWTDPYRP